MSNFNPNLPQDNAKIVVMSTNLYIPSGNILLLETLIKYKTKNTSTKLVSIPFNNLIENKTL